MRSKRVELEQAVITAARHWRTPINGDDAWAESVRQRVGLDLMDAVDALDEYGAAEISGGGVPWAKGSDTSRNSAALAVPLQRSTRHAIVAMLVNVPRMAAPGYTDAQMERRLNKSHQTVSSARNWLVQAGWVIDSGERRPNPSGRPATVWALSTAGQAKLKGTE
jgi:hypothetical protein